MIEMPAGRLIDSSIPSETGHMLQVLLLIIPVYKHNSVLFQKHSNNDC